MIASVELENIKSIGNMNEHGAIFFMTEGPNEHFGISFYDALTLYCEAVDNGHPALTINIEPKETSECQ